MSTGLLERVGTNVERLIVAIDDDEGRAGLDPEDLREIGATQVKASSIRQARDLLLSRGAIAQATEAPEIVIILDLMFPDRPQPGLDLLADIKTGKLTIPIGTPVVVHTARGDANIKLAAKSRGADAYVVKGGRPEELFHSVRKSFTGEVLIAQAICEVVESDADTRQLLVRVRGDDDWIAERWITWDLAPLPARIPGAAFYLQTYRRFGGHFDFTVRATPVESTEEQRELGAIFLGL